MEKSKHYELKRLYYSNLAKNPDSKEWKNWEYRRYSCCEKKTEWKRMQLEPSFFDDHDYRYNPLPKTIIVNGYEVPAPCKTMPDEGELFYYPDISECDLIYESYYNPLNINHNRIFKLGFLHLSEENAIIHARALFGIRE